MAQSQNEQRKAWFNGFAKLKWGILSEIRCAFIAKVVKYNNKKHVADIQPLANFSDGTESAQFLDVPVAENCYIIDDIFDRLKPNLNHYPKQHFMRTGVPVVAVVLDRDNDNWKGGREINTYTPNSSRLHNANDAIVIAVLGGDAING
jgi:mRNA-degrading endonuclease HigB of HigAB toxin-antitoxin module